MGRAGTFSASALAIAVLASSFSAPLIAYAAAPALAIAFWRNGLAVIALAPIAFTARRHELARLLRPGEGRPTVVVCVLAGVALAVHFAAWVPSAKLTDVAMAAALVSTMPVWTAVLARMRGVRVPGMTWVGIGLAVLGVILAAGMDMSVSARAVAGDCLALVGAVAGAVYTTLGERARASISTATYTMACYSVCALTLLAVCIAGGVKLSGFSNTTWFVLIALTVGPQLLGHSMINYALHRVSATTVAALQLLQVPGAALIGSALLDQRINIRALPGLTLLMLGVAVVVLRSPPPEPILSAEVR